MLNKEDRDLLDLAAKAIGLDVVQWVSNYGASDDEGLQFNHKGGGQGVWNPLADEGDAFRLAVKLQLVVCVRSNEVEVFAEEGDRAGECLSSVPILSASMCATGAEATHPYVAACRAVVMAAAALAKEPQ